MLGDEARIMKKLEIYAFCFFECDLKMKRKKEREREMKESWEKRKSELKANL